MVASKSTVLSCDLPSAGTYICVRKCAQMDFYFLLGDTEDAILDEYAFLCGKK